MIIINILIKEMNVEKIENYYASANCRFNLKLSNKNEVRK